MNKYEALFEDEDDVFGGTPSSKFWDIANQANEELVRDVVDRLFEKMVVMEHFLEKSGIDIDKEVKRFVIENSELVETNKKSLYVEYTGEIVCRLDS